MFSALAPLFIFASIFLGLQSVYAQIVWYEREWPNTDFSLIAIEKSEIRGGGPPKDGIPSIDNPKFDSVSKALEWLDLQQPVIAVEIQGEARAYPLQILIYHEIVNDEIANKSIAVTFCPLCNASIVFDRRVAGQVLDFGTTGLLRKSDLVMYDRQTESWWQQFSGKSIVGEFVNTKLKRLPSSIVSFASFSSAYPNGLVLNRETNINRPYGRNPYAGYDDIDQSPFLFDGKVDERLPAMERVITITEGESNKIYPFSVLNDKKLINDVFESVPLVVFAHGQLLSVLDEADISEARSIVEATAWDRRVDGADEPLEFMFKDGHIRDQQTNSSWNVLGQSTQGYFKGTQLLPLDSGVHFAFAWLAFNPQSEIYQ